MSRDQDPRPDGSFEHYLRARYTAQQQHIEESMDRRRGGGDPSGCNRDYDILDR